MLNFNKSFPTEIWFGEGQIENLAEAIQKYNGTRVLFTYGGGSIKKNGVYDDVAEQLDAAGIEFVELAGIQPNPRISSVRTGIELMKKHDLDFILAVGGGSVVDASKAMAAGMCYDGDPWDFFLKKAEPEEAMPLGVVLTLAATGTETNPNCVVSCEDTERKLSLIDPAIIPKFSILDPTYTYTVPKWQTLCGGFDVMSHCFEQYFDQTDGTFLQDRMTEAVIKTCIKYMPIAAEDAKNYEARAQLLWASTIGLNGILGVGKTGDWATHKMEHEISAIYDLTHGAGLAIVTPRWMEYVLDEDNVERFYNAAVNIWGVGPDEDEMAVAEKGIQALKEFIKEVELPSSLKDVDIDGEKIGEMAEKVVLFGEIGNLKPLESSDVEKILEACVE